MADEKDGGKNEKPAAKPVLNAKNRFSKVFGEVIFKAASAQGKVYGADDPDADRMSKKLASVSVENGIGTGAYLSGSIKAIQPKGEAEAYPEFLFQASQFGGQCLKAETRDAQQDLDEYRDHVVDLYTWWVAQGNGAATTTRKQRRTLGISLK